MEKKMKRNAPNVAQSILKNTDSPSRVVRNVLFAAIPLLLAVFCGILCDGCNRRPSRRERVRDSADNTASKVNETDLQELQDQIKSLRQEVAAAKNKAPDAEANGNEVQNRKDEISFPRRGASATEEKIAAEAVDKAEVHRREEEINSLRQMVSAAQEEKTLAENALQKLRDDKERADDQLQMAKSEAESLKSEVASLKNDVLVQKSAKVKAEAELENAKKEVEDLKADVDDLKEKVKAAKDETEEMTARYEEQKKKFDDLMKIVKTRNVAPRAAGPVTGGGQLTSGDKGKIASVQNEKLFVIVQFEDAALDEMLGSERNGALPPHEMLVVRPVKGADGKETRTVVGKIRLRQWTPKTNFVTADILKDWQQVPLIEKGDDVITE